MGVYGGAGVDARDGGAGGAGLAAGRGDGAGAGGGARPLRAQAAAHTRRDASQAQAPAELLAATP